MQPAWCSLLHYVSWDTSIVCGARGYLQCWLFVWQALAPHLEALQSSPKSTMSAKREEHGGGERALVEARLYLTGALFKMDHHPMEVRAPSCCSFNRAYLLHPAQHVQLQPLPEEGSIFSGGSCACSLA